MPTQPEGATIRMYNVGFGDCFLLTFRYADGARHILIDFGTVSKGGDMVKIARDIEQACGKKLYAVIATHRHRDHISGFSDAGGAGSSGAIIAGCKPAMVLQPWTENPKAGADAKTAPVLAARQNFTAQHLFYAQLNGMQQFAANVAAIAPRFRGKAGRRLPIERVAENNTTNPEAVRNLREMAPKKGRRYLHYGAKSGLEAGLPGVTVHVLGPPTLEQQNIRKYAKESPEYWLAGKYWAIQAMASSPQRKRALFPGAARHAAGTKPFESRWFIRRADNVYKRNIFDIVNILDDFLNNTSLILLFEFNGKKLLFPGDAQLENWQYALGQPGMDALLSGVDLYKVGHHGSRNATPRSLWDAFDKRRSLDPHEILRSLMSTKSGTYNKSKEGKVPADNLVTALKKDSILDTTLGLGTKIGPVVVEL